MELNLGPPEKVKNLGIWGLQKRRNIWGCGTSRKGEKSGDLGPPENAKNLEIWDLQEKRKIWRVWTKD